MTEERRHEFAEAVKSGEDARAAADGTGLPRAIVLAGGELNRLCQTVEFDPGHQYLVSIHAILKVG